MSDYLGLESETEKLFREQNISGSEIELEGIAEKLSHKTGLDFDVVLESVRASWKDVEERMHWGD